jgi:hypothetical protein
VQDIDLFSLDVEGAELAVLQTIDFAVLNVHVFLIEQAAYDLKRDEDVRILLRSHGFKISDFSMKDGCTPGRDCASNEAWINPGFESLRLQRKKGELPGPQSLLGRYYYYPGTGIRVP